MKTISSILLIFTLSSSFSQSAYLKSSDSILIAKVNQYRKSKGLGQVKFDQTQTQILTSKLQWMASRKTVSHSDPLDAMEITRKNLMKQNSTADTTVRYHQTGECLILTFFEVPFADTVHFKEFAEKRIDVIADSVIAGWKRSPAHNHILLDEILNPTTQHITALGSVILDPTIYDDSFSKKVRRYSIFAIYIKHVGDKEKKRTGYSYIIKN